MTEFRPTRFEILPLIVKNLIIINALVFLAQNVLTAQTIGFSINDTLALHAWQSVFFKPWQLLTHMFMHGDIGHLFSNMFALWMFGSILENLWGPKRFLTFYLICGLGAALCHLTVLYFEMQPVIEKFNQLSYEEQQYLIKNPEYVLNGITLGASGAVFGCLAAFGYLFPNTYIYIYFLFPLKAKWFVLIYAFFELYNGIKNSAGDNVAHFAHLGGALFGILLVITWNKTNRRNFY